MFHGYQSFVETEEKSIVMITRPLVVVIICFGVFILFQSLVPKVMSLKRSSKLNEFMIEDQRTRKRKNYVMRVARDSEVIGNTDRMATTYDTEPLQSDPEELSAFIVDYANMIRNDVILLDNSVETRTRKRGNIKVKKVNQAIPDPPCNCEYKENMTDLGVTTYPRYVKTRNCTSAPQQTCVYPYICKENSYELIVIRRKERGERYVEIDETLEPFPSELKNKWVPEIRQINVGCICTSNYIIHN